MAAPDPRCLPFWRRVLYYFRRAIAATNGATVATVIVLAVLVINSAIVFARYERTRAACLAAGWPRATLSWDGGGLRGYCVSGEGAVGVEELPTWTP